MTRTGEYEPFDVVTRRALGRVSPGLDSAMSARLCAAWLSLPPYPDAAATLRRLDEAGLAVAVLSNGTADMIRRALDAAGLPIETILSADQVHTYKPDARVYALLDELAPREETLFVSANGWDADGARRAGHAVCWVDRGGAAAEVAPDLRAGSLAEVAEHLLAPASRSDG
jgi:2-haloacid dehalogenase